MSALRRLRASAVHFAQGLLMGGADIVPGVSGGTMALIVGIYERLIHSVRSVAGAATLAARGRIADARARLNEADWGLILPLGAGIVAALLLGARVIPGLLEAYPEAMRAIFFGLIAGSVAIPWQRIDHPGARHVGIAAATALAAFLLVGLPPQQVADPSLLVVFAAAAVAICAMILPGISGSFLLLVFGMYEPTLAAVNDRALGYVAVFVLGAAVGLGAFSRLLDHMLSHHHDPTMAALVGLMVGSLRALWPYQGPDRELLAPPGTPSLLTALALALLGFAAVTLLARFALGRIPVEHRPADG